MSIRSIEKIYLAPKRECYFKKCVFHLGWLLMLIESGKSDMQASIRNDMESAMLLVVGRKCEVRYTDNDMGSAMLQSRL
jgi:hypothetical protein